MDVESKYKPETVSKESLIVKDYSRNLQKIHKSEIFKKIQVIFDAMHWILRKPKLQLLEG